MNCFSFIAKEENAEKNKKEKNHRNSDDQTRPLLEKDSGQEYAIATKMLGSARVKVKCYDGKERIGLIRGKMRKRVWIKVDDLVLVALRDFNDDQCDIIHKYKSEEARSLKNSGQLVDINGEDLYGDFDHNSEPEEDTFVFEEL